MKMSATNRNLVYLCVFVLFFFIVLQLTAGAGDWWKKHRDMGDWNSDAAQCEHLNCTLSQLSWGQRAVVALQHVILCMMFSTVNQSIGILINAKQSIALMLRQGCPFFRKQNNYSKCTDSQHQLSLKSYSRECIFSPCLLPLVNQVTLKSLTSAVHAYLHLSNLCVCRRCYETWRLALVWGTKRWVLTGAPEHKDKRMTRTTTPCSKNKQTPHFNFLFCAEPSKRSASISWVETERNGNKPKFRLNHPTSVCSSLQRSNE